VILRGVKRPADCKLFGTVCTPESPMGSCMKSRCSTAPGDMLLLSVPIGDHGVAVMSRRASLEFETTIESNSVAPHGLVAALRAHPLGAQAARIGEVVADDHRFVQMATRFGGQRVVDWLAGEQLPRIC
jgi:hydrogenase maturation factor